jgi:CHASE2 domain-containing sensor protein
MFDFNTLAEFSRHYCIGICAFLVPANLAATSLTMIFAMLRRPAVQVWLAAGIASIFALVMMLHVFTWFMVGMVMAPTYILLCLGSICLFANFGAIFLARRNAIPLRLLY